jgi:hypothetical protein
MLARFLILLTLHLMMTGLVTWFVVHNHLKDRASNRKNQNLEVVTRTVVVPEYKTIGSSDGS